MAQTYQMKHNPQGTIYSLLTVESDGQMTMMFHGTDREICHEANVTEDGRITTGGSLFPGLESGKWQLMADVRGLRADVVETTDGTDNHAEPEIIEETTDYTDCTDNEPRPRRQRKPRKPRVERETITNNREPLTVIATPHSQRENRQSSSTMKAVGMVAAATVALFVIYETGLLIPLGLIGLATGGLLK